ncbi:MAG: N-acetylmuramic acid 6-phosphate etherase [Candidatus Omnitrophica bacterium]|nr:N-acetylmuramic acid 6-phosphate etherase [Candidatus Omnitrophota bacterium]
MKRVDYSKLPTEKINRRSKRIDGIPIEKAIEMINSEDANVPKAVAKTKRQIAAGVRLIVHSLRSGGRLFFAGAGTSGRLGILEAAECPPTFNTPPSLVQAVMAGGKKAVFRSQEGAEDNKEEGLRIFRKKLRPKDILIGIAASGVTPFVAGALQAAKEKKIKTILVACNDASPFRHFIDCLIAPKVGPEVITGSTRLKAGTATKLVLNMLTVCSMIGLGKVYQNWMVDLQPKSKKLTARALSIIQRLGKVSAKEASLYFHKSKKNAKLAILMARKNWDYPRAARSLKKHNGFLREALQVSSPKSFVENEK